MLVSTMAGDIEGALQSAASITDQKAKIDQYKLLLSSIICTNNVAHSKSFIDHSTYLLPNLIFASFARPEVFLHFLHFLCGFYRCFAGVTKTDPQCRFFSGVDTKVGYFAVVTDEVPLVASRLLLQIFAQDLNKLEGEAHKEIAQYALAQIQPRVVSFEEQVSPLIWLSGMRRLKVAIQSYAEFRPRF